MVAFQNADIVGGQFKAGRRVQIAADLLEATAPDLAEKLPPLAPSATVAGTLAAYFPGQDIAISIAVTQQQSRALFRVFIDAVTVLRESMAAASAEG